MTSGYAQGSRRLWAEKVFNVSLHRSGTKSVHDLLVRSGVSSVHWPSTFEGVDYETRVAGHENDRPYVASVLAPVIASVTGVGDVPIGALYDELDAMHPESAFILMYRSPFDWVRSVRHHVGERDLEPFERTQYWRWVLRLSAVVWLTVPSLLRFCATVGLVLRLPGWAGVRAYRVLGA